MSAALTCHAGDYKDWPYAALSILNCITPVDLLGAFYDGQYFDLRKSAGAGASTTGEESVYLPLCVAFGTGIALSIGWLLALRVGASWHRLCCADSAGDVHPVCGAGGLLLPSTRAPLTVPLYRVKSLALSSSDCSLPSRCAGGIAYR